MGTQVQSAQGFGNQRDLSHIDKKDSAEYKNSCMDRLAIAKNLLMDRLSSMGTAMANTFRSAPQSVQPVKKRRRRRHHPRKVSKPQPKRIRTEPKVQKVQPKAKPLRIQEVKECDCCKLARVKSLFSNTQWKLNQPCCIECTNEKNALSG